MKEREAFWGRAVSGLAPSEEPLTVEHGSLRNRRRRISMSAWWFRLQTGHGYD